MENGTQGGSAGLAAYLDINVIISCLTVTVILTLVAVIGMRRTDTVPRGTQALMEHIYLWLEGLAIGLMGPIGRRYVPFCMAIFLYVLVANWVGLIPDFLDWFGPLKPLAPILEPATSSVNVTLAMAIISFCAFMVLGIHRSIERASAPSHSHGDHDHGDHDHSHGDGGGVVGGLISWISHYIQPIPSLWTSLEGAMRYALVPLLLFLFIFLNIVEELARILSLTFRLYGNIFGEHQVKLQFAGLITTFSNQTMHAMGATDIVAGAGFGIMTLLLWGSLLFVMCLGTLAGFIQAFVFALLTMSYIAHAVADHH